MKITTLVENTGPETLTTRHGLSLFIETRTRTLLLDAGPDDALASNAQSLGIDLARVDLALVSHGHYDHGGGLPVFQELNPSALTLMGEKAARPTFVRLPGAEDREVGLDFARIDRARCRFIREDTQIDDHLTLFIGFPHKGFVPAGNRFLFREYADRTIRPDDFAHETALLISEQGKTVLVTGCSHSGIGNMVAAVLDRAQLSHIDHVIGGFHLSSAGSTAAEPQERVALVARELAAYDRTTFHTGHCTGQAALTQLRQTLGNQVQAISTGSQLVI